MNTGVNTIQYTQSLNTQVTYFLDFSTDFFLDNLIRVLHGIFIGCNYSDGDNKYPEEKNDDDDGRADTWNDHYCDIIDWVTKGACSSESIFLCEFQIFGILLV